MKKEQPSIEKDGYEVADGFRIRPKQSSTGLRFEVDLGRVGNIKHKRLSFPTKAAARKCAAEERIKRKNFGIKAANDLNAQKQQDVVEAIEMLKTYGVDLREVAGFYIKHHQPVDETNRFGTLIERYLESMVKRKLRPATITDATTRLRPFTDAWEDQAIDSIAATDIDALLDERGLSGTNRDNYLRRLEAFFNWAVKSKLTTSNPAIQCEAVTLEWEMPEIYRPSQAQAILRMAEMGDEAKDQPPRHKLIPYLSVLFFAGVRPMEAARLKWSDIDLESSEIHIRAGQSKTRKARLVPISENLKSWLLKYRSVGGEDKRILPCSPAALAKWRRALLKAAGVPAITDGARHSFATYSLAANGLDYTIEALGHGDAQMLNKHYKALVKNRKAAAGKFFAIEPKSESKILQLKRGAA